MSTRASASVQRIRFTPCLFLISLSTVFLGLLLTASAISREPLDIASPEHTRSVEPRTPERERWSWNRRHARVTETGELEWAPHPFEFVAGDSVRYIDYEGGDDNNDGLSTLTPWQHHPWDPNAAGRAAEAEGVDTCVFKRGATYRGTLIARDSGTPETPIRLTSDPDWGEGDAVIAGSEVVTGWRQGADHADIPDGDRVWWVDLDFDPRNVWMVEDGEITRIDLARIPNWTDSDPHDPLSEWWTWDNPEWWRNHWKIDTDGGRRHFSVSRHLDRSADHYVGAVLRTEYGNVMGTPYPTRVEAFAPAGDLVNLDQIEGDDRRRAAQTLSGVVFQGMWFGDSTNIRQHHRFYLEDKPHYLDVPGQFWFDRRDDGGGRLYLRLPDERDPNDTRVEVARHIHLLQDQASARCPDRLDILSPDQRAALDTTGVSHLEVTGLTFRFTNTHWDLTLQAWGHEDVANAAIRLRGTGSDIRIANNRFEHVAKALRVAMIRDDCHIDRVAFTDNEILFTDHGAIGLPGRRSSGNAGHVTILRNRLHEIGRRVYRNSHGHALTARLPVTSEVAGNILTRCYGAGIVVTGGKGRRLAIAAPLSRHLLYNNSVVDSLLAANDWGGIETFFGGPFYVYNNISGNASGYWHASYMASRSRPVVNSRLGFAYYMDTSYKNYAFNNIAWGITSALDSRLAANSAFYHANPTIFNSFFNNTAARPSSSTITGT